MTTEVQSLFPTALAAVVPQLRGEQPAPPPAKSVPSIDTPGGRLTSGQKFHLAVQRDRAVALTVAAVAAWIAHAAGFVLVDTATALGVLAFGYFTSAVFHRVYRTSWAREHTLDIAPVWLACDIGIVTAMVYLTGGVASPWFLWYLACAGAAALIGGLGWVVVVAVVSSVAYIFVLVSMGEISGIDSALYYAVAQIAFLFGASSIVLIGTAKLRRDHAQVKRLRESETRRAEELSLLTGELDEANARLRELTLTDPLTGLHNRRFLEDRMRSPRDRRRGAGKTNAGVMLVDLDHFKQVNDVHGHGVGDRVLRHVAELLQRCVRMGDSVVRWGGEEFLVLLVDANAERIAEVAARILLAVRSQPIPLESGQSLNITCSAGWSQFAWTAEPGAAGHWELALESADQGLYLAKAAGRDRSCTLPVERQPRTELDFMAALEASAEAVMA